VRHDEHRHECGTILVKIGLVSPYDWSYPGGVKSHIAHLAAELRARGHTVRILTPATGQSARQVEYGIYKLGWAAPFRVNGSVARVSLAPDINGHIADLLERERFDVLHVHEPLASVLPLTILGAASRLRAVTVATFHASVRRGSVSTPPEWAYASARPFLRHYFRRLNGLIAVSEAAENFVGRYFQGEYHIIPNGVDIARFRDAPPRPELRDGKTNVLFVGRIEKRKGLKYLLRAIPAVREHLPNTRFIIVGDGPLRAGYERLVDKLGWQDVIFAGRVSDADLPGYYASADIFCAPNTGSESQGIVLLEALAAGAPTIASNIPGYRTVIRHGVEGLLVPPGRSEDLAWAICHLEAHPTEREHLRALGQLRAEDYSWERVANKVEAYYEELLTTRAHRLALLAQAPTPQDELATAHQAAEALARSGKPLRRAQQTQPAGSLNGVTGDDFA
jgi:phosphatidylinositol alpha-mannosyltransferase